MRLSTLAKAVLWIATSTAVFLLASCKKTSSYLKDDIRYFQELLSADMDYNDLLSTFGEPTADINAEWADADGLHIYQYALYDSTFVRIGFTDKIEYACLVDDHNNLIEDILITDSR